MDVDDFKEFLKKIEGKWKIWGKCEKYLKRFPKKTKKKQKKTKTESITLLTPGVELVGSKDWPLQWLVIFQNVSFLKFYFKEKKKFWDIYMNF